MGLCAEAARACRGPDCHRRRLPELLRSRFGPPRRSSITPLRTRQLPRSIERGIRLFSAYPRFAVIGASRPSATKSAKFGNRPMPIVFSMGDDPVSAGVVDSFGRPGGNITGVSFFVLELGTKLLDLATELRPNAVSIGLLANPSRPSYKPISDTIEGG